MKRILLCTTIILGSLIVFDAGAAGFMIFDKHNQRQRIEQYGDGSVDVRILDNNGFPIGTYKPRGDGYTFYDKNGFPQFSIKHNEVPQYLLKNPLTNSR